MQKNQVFLLNLLFFTNHELFNKIRNQKGDIIMKRSILFILILILINSTIFSRIINHNEAERVAFIWLQNENSSKEFRIIKENLSFINLIDLKYRGEKIGYIVNLDPKGFMIMSTISELSPVKFVSYSSEYEKVGDHPFIEAIKYDIYHFMHKLGYGTEKPLGKPDLFLIDKNKLDKVQIKKNELVWKKLLSGNIIQIKDLIFPKTGVTPLLHSKWGQNFPYNMYTPYINGSQPPAGCVATAMAQVMYYWKYPEKGQGSNTYKWNGQTLEADFNHKYYWSKMRDLYTGSEKEEENDAVARLLSDVGISVNMDYSMDGSSAMINGNNSFIYFFKYSSDIHSVEKSEHSIDEWYDLIKSQIDEGWPTISCIWKKEEGETVGHAVVFDGYRKHIEVNQVHVNMGWEGSYDNYYSLDDIANGWALSRVFIDIHPPLKLEIKITNPRTGSIVSGTIDVEASVNYAGNIDNVVFYIDEVLEYTDTTPPYIFSWDTSNHTDDSHKIKAVVSNKSGNKAEDEINIFVYNLNVRLEAERKEERAWIIKRQYGEVGLLVNNPGSTPVSKYILYKKESNSGYEIVKEIPFSEFEKGKYIYYDKYLDKDKTYTYKVEVINPDGIIIVTPEPVTI